MHDFEKLGGFYLGKRHDTDADKLTDELVLYDSKDLTTHAAIIGMTGSGKTGLGWRSESGKLTGTLSLQICGKSAQRRVIERKTKTAGWTQILNLDGLALGLSSVSGVS